MWWAHRDAVMKMNMDRVRNLEGTSFALFNKPTNNTIMTRDWLDFSVEHSSKYIKHFQRDIRHDGTTFQRLIDIIQGYLEKVKQHQEIPNSKTMQLPTRDTIAIIPFFSTEAQSRTAQDYLSMQNSTHQLRRKKEERKSILTMHSLASTIASLYQVGMGRVVVIGRRQQVPELVKAAFAIIHDLTMNDTDQMEVAYAWGLNATTEKVEKGIHLPTYAIKKLQSAMREDLDSGEATSILGETPSRWKYVYYSEPDLILHARKTTLPYFRDHLDQGNAIAAHRFQVMPHEVDHPSYRFPNRLVPNIGHFSTFHDLDPEVDSCCDAGNYWPGKDERCRALWHNCGFSGRDNRGRYNVREVLEKHKRLVNYPMIRLKKTGLGVFLVHNHARLCHPSRLGTCPDPQVKQKAL